jgi:hypothetical protein
MGREGQEVVEGLSRTTNLGSIEMKFYLTNKI